MKKIGILFIFFMLMAAVTTAQAEVKAGSFSFTPFVGWYVFEKNQDLKDSPIVGLRAGYNFTENIGVEGFFSYVKTEYQENKEYWWEPWQNVYSYGVEGLYHFMPSSRFVPFIAIGLGGTSYSAAYSYQQNDYGDRLAANRFTVDYGAGMKFFLMDNIALRVDVRHVLPLNDRYWKDNHIHNDFLATVGINFAFGGTAKKEETPAPENLDSDNDGVLDYLDKCSCTPAGATVDKFGCTLDSDKDGVPDYLDKCPGTPAGMVVDENGCPTDSDKDGVPDYLDRCPGTPAGANVDENGCPTDSDKDGVSDYLDKCPDTPTGVNVDKNGCPPTTAPVVEKKKVSIVLKLEFDTNKSVIKKQYHKEIKKVADFMKANSEVTATIIGHTDNVGNAKKNILLSKARADSVRQYLIDKFGIDHSRIKTFGYGSDKPIASNATKNGRQKNRRVVAVFEGFETK